MRLRSTIPMATALTVVMLGGVAAPAAAADQVRVGLSSVYPAYSVVFAAKELGYYKDKGLEVEVTNFRSGPATQEALAGGAIDISTIAPAAAALAIAKGVQEQLVALSVPPTPAGWYIMTPTDSPIKTIADLNGKLIGVTQKGSLTDLLTLEAVNAAHITAQTIPLGFPGLLPGLKSKQVDAVTIFPLNSYKAQVSGDARVVVDLAASTPPSVHEGWAVTGAMIKDHPDVIKRWLSANAKALIYMQKNEAWTIDFLKKYTEENNDKVIKMVFDTFMTKIPADGVMKPEWKKASLDLAAAAGLTQKLPPVDQVFSDKFTPVSPD